MRPVSPRERPRGGDPAPSRWRFRMERLWLTPLFRAFVRTGLPCLAVVLALTWYLHDEGRIEAIGTWYSDTLGALQDRPEFMVSLLRIEGASEELQEDILETLPVDLPLSQFKLDIEGLRKRLLALDPVLDAEVRVRAGGVLVMAVTERTPAVAWQSDDGIEVLDAEGHRIASVASLDGAGALPLIAGPGADAAVPEALTLIAAADPIRDRLVGLTRVGNRRWDVVLTDAQLIALPEESPVAALDRALAMHAARDVLARDVRVVDLRLSDRPILRLSPEARGELKVLQDLERMSLEMPKGDP